MNNKIDYYKEILSVLPRNNIKNNRNYVKKALAIKSEVDNSKQEVLRELKTRYNKLNVFNNGQDFTMLEEFVNNASNNMYLLNDFNDSYEKSGLDEEFYAIDKFYKNDLDNVNKDILNSIKIFDLVGVSLTYNDFYYGEYVSSYMKTFFEEISNIESARLKEAFDEIYWKCPDIIKYINLNFRCLYFKYIKYFDNYYDRKLKELNVVKEDYLNKYKDNLREYLLLKNSNIVTIKDEFLNGTLDIKEYSKDKIDKIKETIVSIDTDNENILKLSYTLNEYKYYCKYKYVIEEIKKIYGEKANNKSLTKSILKDISKKESNILKANKKIHKKPLFGKRDVYKLYSVINTNMIELKELYKNYDEAKFKEKIANCLTDNSTLLDALKIAVSFKLNLRDIIKSVNPEVTNEEIDLAVKEINELIYYPNNTIINNITINDDRDILLIILDKYKLMNINISNDMLDESNLDGFIATINKILVYYYIEKSGFTYEQISNICEIKKVLDKESFV